MELDSDKIISESVRDGIREGIKKRLMDGYNSPLSRLLESAIETHSVKFKQLLEYSIGTCIEDAAFREEIASSVRHTLAKTLVQRFGGEMEKQINILKSDPTTRARITLAIEEIVRSKATE